MIYKVLAILILVLFYSIYFGKILFQKRKGITTNQIGKGNKKKRVYVIEMIMKVITIVVVIMEVATIILDYSLSPYWLKIIGSFVGFIGVGVFFCAVYTMRDSWRAGISNDKTKLVDSGIYSVSRNPAFLGFDLVYVGILLIFFNWYLFVITLLAILILHIQILQEEEYLPTVFKEEYLIYKNRVCRYIGRKMSYYRR